MVYYFNTALFKFAHFNVVFFTVSLIMPYCLLAFNVSLFSDIIFNVVFSNAVLLCWKFYILFLDNCLFYVALITDSFSLSPPKEFFIRLVLIGVFAYFVNFSRLDLSKQNNWCNFGFHVFNFNIFDHLTKNVFRECCLGTPLESKIEWTNKMFT